MKRAYLVALAILFTFGGGVAVRAHSVLYGVNIPFPFYIGDRQLPAGNYYVESKRPTENSGLTFEFLRTEENAAVPLPSIFSLESENKTSEARLIFHEYGSVHFLFQFWGSYGEGKQLAVSPLEREMASKQVPQDVSVAAHQ